MVGQLPAGTYTVQFSRYGHTTQWFDGAADAGGATPVTVGQGQVLSISAALAAVPEAIQGTVTDAVTHLPVAGVCIQSSLVPAAPYPPNPPPAQLPGSCPGAFSGPTGAYALGVGVTGPYSYILEASDPEGRYATEFYLDTTDLLAATPVSVPGVANFALGGTGDADGDGVIEPPGYDGNGDFVPDDQQDNVTTLPAAEGGASVTIESPAGESGRIYAYAQPLSAGPPPPAGVDFPVGVLGFTIELVGDIAEVDVVVHLPAGTNPTGYFKLQGGAWVDFSSHATIAGDVITLHLVDGGAGDADGLANGVIVDPGAPVVGYTFSGFLSPSGADKSSKAGSTVPVKWRITSAAGAPVDDPASFVGLTSAPCGGGLSEPAVAPGASGLKSQGGGSWQVNWKTAKGYAGQCRTLTLLLADGLGGRTVDVQFK